MINPYIVEKIYDIIKLIGDNPEREGMQQTAERVAGMYEEIFKGYNKENKPKLTVFNNTEHYDQMIFDKTYFYSMCEHHIIPFFGNAFIAYIPNKKLIGLSKLNRIVDFYAAKLQTQERLTHEIANELWKELKPKGVAVMLKARHLCKEMRGVKKQNSKMITSCLKGVFLEKDNNVRNEFLKMTEL